MYKIKINKQGYANDKLLRIKLNPTEYSNVIFWSNCICYFQHELPKFSTFVVGNECIYVIYLNKKSVHKKIHYDVSKIKLFIIVIK